MKEILNTLFAIDKLKGGFYRFIFLSWTLTPFVGLFNKYFFADWQFLGWLGVLIGIDTVLSFTIHFKSRTLSSNGFSKLFVKLIIYSCFLILTHVITNFKVGGAANDIFSWFDSMAYSAIIIREAISILEKMAVLSPGLIPDWILSKLKGFDKTGKVNTDTHGEG